MGTKNNPGSAGTESYANALPDEPMFILLARDPEFFDMVNLWAHRRLIAIQRGERPESDKHMVAEAEECALSGAQWARDTGRQAGAEITRAMVDAACDVLEESGLLEWGQTPNRVVVERMIRAALARASVNLE